MKKKFFKKLISDLFYTLLITGIYGFTFAYGIIQYCIR